MNLLTGTTLRRVAALAPALALVAALAAPAAADVVLSDNLGNTNAGVETAVGSSWLASSFGAGPTDSTLSSVTLLLNETAAGTAEVDLYSDGGLVPGSPLGRLAQTGAVSSTGLAAATFTSGSIALTAGSTYWVVLKATSGQFDWGWTADDTGAGAGFQDTWGGSDDAGASWYSFDSSPTQMTVAATFGVAAVPEPGTTGLLATGLLATAARRLARRRRHTAV